MGYYKALDPDWVFIPARSKSGNDWKIGMLGYRLVGKEPRLKDSHIIATKPAHVGSYSDIHVTFVLADTTKEHIHYQVNNGDLVADYVLAPHNWRSSYWVNFPALRATTEAEALNFVRYWRVEGKLESTPRPV